MFICWTSVQMLLADLALVYTYIVYCTLDQCIVGGLTQVPILKLSCHTKVQCPPQLLEPLVNMNKTGYEKNMSLLFILLVFHSKYSQKSYLFIEVKLLKEKKTVDIK